MHSNLRTTVALIVLLHVFLGAARALTHLVPGPQQLEGVLVRKTSADDVPRTDIGIVLAPGTRSERYVSVGVGPGGGAIETWLHQNATTRRPLGDPYMGIVRHRLRGDLKGGRGKWYSFTVNEIPDSPQAPGAADPVESIRAAWRHRALHSEPGPRKDEILRALKDLDETGFLEEMARSKVGIDD